jgi:mannose-6-phosphate isomerase-like protein (cupin superfamily)
MSQPTPHADPAGEPTPLRATVAEAVAAPIPEGRQSSLLMAHGSMEVRFYAPRGIDAQTPHTQDELYVVARGSGWFVCGDRRTPCGAGDVLFAAAGAVHRFEDFGDDFAVWVIFYGPEGGEVYA